MSLNNNSLPEDHHLITFGAQVISAPFLLHSASASAELRIQTMASSSIGLLLLFFSLLHSGSAALSVDYYAETCPGAEAAVAEAVKRATKNDKTVPAAMLRLHFHDCFIRVCLALS